MLAWLHIMAAESQVLPGPCIRGTVLAALLCLPQPFSPGLQYNNGLQEYANWAVGPTAAPLDFYTNPTAQGYYRDHVKTVINRVNTINGRPCEAAC